MAARKTAAAEDEAKVEEAQADEAKAEDKADEQAVDDRADGPISLGVDSEKKAEDAGLTLTKDIQGRVVGESSTGRTFSTLDNEVGDPSIVQPSPGGPTPEAGVTLGHNGE